ncbi:MAG: division/outer membrane stress-associated lipid-binding lipoprotein [Gammaproteobacteria bacterium]
MNLPKQAIGLISICLLLTGCAAAVVGGAATGVSVAHDRRTPGTVVDDQAIELKAYNLIGGDPALEKNTHINVTSYNLKVLLTGEAASNALRTKAARLVSGIPKVRQVHNYVVVAPSTSLGSRTKDTWITTKVKSGLFNIEIPDFDPTRVKVVTEAQTVFLLGLVTRQEGRAAINVARQVADVKKVVALFEYL